MATRPVRPRDTGGRPADWRRSTAPTCRRQFIGGDCMRKRSITNHQEALSSLNGRKPPLRHDVGPKAASSPRGFGTRPATISTTPGTARRHHRLRAGAQERRADLSAREFRTEQPAHPKPRLRRRDLADPLLEFGLRCRSPMRSHGVKPRPNSALVSVETPRYTVPPCTLAGSRHHCRSCGCRDFVG